MLIIVDKRIPDSAKMSLAEFGEIIEFFTERITYEAISGHPDIFFCKTPTGLVVAPNTPAIYIRLLEEQQVPFTMGSSEVGMVYPASARYNALITEHYLIHHLSDTDPEIKKIVLKRQLGSPVMNPQLINVHQGYTNCNLQYLGNGAFLTSDKGICNTLMANGIKVTFVSPSGILLPGMKYGFIGGCCGMMNQSLFILGKLRYYQDGESVRSAAEEQGLTVRELYDGPLFDGGGILFI